MKFNYKFETFPTHTPTKQTQTNYKVTLNPNIKPHLHPHTKPQRKHATTPSPPMAASDKNPPRKRSFKQRCRPRRSPRRSARRSPRRSIHGQLKRPIAVTPHNCGVNFSPRPHIYGGHRRRAFHLGPVLFLSRLLIIRSGSVMFRTCLARIEIISRAEAR